MSWRDRAQQVIRDTLRAHPGVTGKELRAVLKAAYPFGERRYFPYKVWCEEVRKATGTAQKLAALRQDQELVRTGTAQKLAALRQDQELVRDGLFKEREDVD